MATPFIDLADAKTHLEVEHDAHDALIESLIAAAERQVENLTNIVCTRRSASFTFDAFADELVIPLVPVAADSAVVTYLDATGDEQTLDDAVVRVVMIDGIYRLVAAPGAEWPETYPARAAVTVTADVGFAPDSAGIETLKHAARLLVGHWYRNRETVVTGTIASELPQSARQLLENERVILP